MKQVQLASVPTRAKDTTYATEQGEDSESQNVHPVNRPAATVQVQNDGAAPHECATETTFCVDMCIDNQDHYSRGSGELEPNIGDDISDPTTMAFACGRTSRQDNRAWRARGEGSGELEPDKGNDISDPTTTAFACGRASRQDNRAWSAQTTTATANNCDSQQLQTIATAK